jgi:hypothetical protein
MAAYIFELTWRAANDLRVEEVVSTISILKDGFGLPHLYTEDGPFPITKDTIQKLFEEKRRETGVLLALPAFPMKEQSEGMVFRVTVGSPPEPSIFRDYLILYIGDCNVSGKVGYLERCIVVATPAEAYLGDEQNEHALHFFERARATENILRPAIIRWFHYMDHRMVESLGGIDFCLRAPAWRAWEFHQGVIIQLTEQRFEPTNPDHLKVQEEVMRYFGVWDMPPDWP